MESKDSKIIAACCLRSKLYALLYEDGNELLKMVKKKLLCIWQLKYILRKIYIFFQKGTPATCFVINGIIFQAYQNCLNEIPLKKTEFWRIGSKGHEVSKFLQKKSTLVSAFDDKRYLLNCGKHSFPYGSIYAKKKYAKNCPFCK